jgi:hypothetical protein
MALEWNNIIGNEDEHPGSLVSVQSRLKLRLT